MQARCIWDRQYACDLRRSTACFSMERIQQYIMSGVTSTDDKHNQIATHVGKRCECLSPGPRRCSRVFVVPNVPQQTLLLTHAELWLSAFACCLPVASYRSFFNLNCCWCCRRCHRRRRVPFGGVVPVMPPASERKRYGYSASCSTRTW